MLGQILDMTLLKSKHAHSGYSVLAELFFYGFICKISKNFAIIEINANSRFCMISWFRDEA